MVCYILFIMFIIGNVLYYINMKLIIDYMFNIFLKGIIVFYYIMLIYLQGLLMNINNDDCNLVDYVLGMLNVYYCF